MLSNLESEIIFRKYEGIADQLMNSIKGKLIDLEYSLVDRSNRKRLDVGHGYDGLWWGYEVNKVWETKGKKKFVGLRLSFEEKPWQFFENIPDWEETLPPAISASIYRGTGNMSNLSSRVASKEVEYYQINRVVIKELTASKFFSFIANSIEQASHELENKQL